MTEATLLLGFADYLEPAKRLAETCQINFAEVELHRFPDGESKLVLPDHLPENIVFCRSLYDPNHKLVELLLAAKSAREHGVKQITLVAPYLCYMRQDKAFHPGEVVSQKIIGQLLAGLFDVVITVDAHLHRIHRLSEAIPIEHAINLTATAPMADFIQQHVDNAFLIGPDNESRQWVSAIAASAGLDFVVANKERFGDRDVSITLPDAVYDDRHIVLVDDVASTGKTLLAVAEQLQDLSVASVDVMVNHALFVNDAIEQLKAAGVRHIWSCDSIPHRTNQISLSGLLADSLQAFI